LPASGSADRGIAARSRQPSKRQKHERRPPSAEPRSPGRLIDTASVCGGKKKRFQVTRFNSLLPDPHAGFERVAAENWMPSALLRRPVFTRPTSTLRRAPARSRRQSRNLFVAFHSPVRILAFQRNPGGVKRSWPTTSVPNTANRTRSVPTYCPGASRDVQCDLWPKPVARLHDALSNGFANRHSPPGRKPLGIEALD
jgi:hypothetical protein